MHLCGSGLLSSSLRKATRQPCVPRVLQSSRVCMCAIQRGLLGPARSFPWELARGNIADYIIALGETHVPQADFDEGMGAKVVNTVANILLHSSFLWCSRCLTWSWCPRAVEQEHGSCAATHTFHLHLTVFWLSRRSLLHPCRGEVPN